MAERSPIAALGAEQLGAWRLFLRAPLRTLKRELAPGEAIECIVAGTAPRLQAALLVATDKRLLFLREPLSGPVRCSALAYDAVTELRVKRTPGWAAIRVSSSTTTWTLDPDEPKWVDRLVDVLATRTSCPTLTGDGDFDSFGWGPPLGARVYVWLLAMVIGIVGAACVWWAEPASRVVVGLVFFAAVVHMLWLARRGSARVTVDRDGVALRTRNRSRYAWSQIERFEAEDVWAEGMFGPERLDSAAMVLRGGSGSGCARWWPTVASAPPATSARACIR